MTILKSLKTIINYLLISFLLTTLLLINFYKGSGSIENILSAIYIISIPTYYFFIILLITIILFPLNFIPYVRYLIVLPKTVIDFLLLADIFVFKTYRFHIDLMFIDMVVNDYHGVGLSLSIVIISVVLIILAAAINIYLFRISKKTNIKYCKSIFIILLSVFVIGQSTHIWASKFHRQYITKYTPYFPYYFPTTSNRLITKLSEIIPALVPDDYDPQKHAENIFSNSPNSTSLFNYPLNNISINDSLTGKYNILFFIVESWRSDMLKKEITPNIYNLAQKSYNFKNHFSGGNVTIPGLFSIMYGLHSSYMSFAQSDAVKYNTVLTKTLVKNGYDIKAYTSQNFDRFALKPMFFTGISPENYHCIYSGKPEMIDSILTQKIVYDIKNDSIHNPWFKFIFFSSSHFHYNYPKQYEKFQPIPKNSEGFLFNKDIDPKPYLNDYSNALLYEDALFKKIYDSIKASGQLKNTVIFILSDHGEEFNDNKKGYWGHGSNFTRYQTSTPLIVHMPGQQEQVLVNIRSSHIDIVPTILHDFLKCKNPIRDYSNGYSLFNLPDNRSLVITSYKDKCYVIDDRVYSTGITISSYDINDINKSNKNYNYTGLNSIKNEEQLFVK